MYTLCDVDKLGPVERDCQGRQKLQKGVLQQSPAEGQQRALHFHRHPREVLSAD